MAAPEEAGLGASGKPKASQVHGQAGESLVSSATCQVENMEARVRTAEAQKEQYKALFEVSSARAPSPSSQVSLVPTTLW